MEKFKNSKKKLVFELPELYVWEFPEIKRKKGTKFKITQFEGGIDMETGGPIKEIEILGNSDGLIYLGSYLLALALHSDDHVHLKSGNELDLDSENVTIRQLDSRIVKILNDENLREEEIHAIQEYYDRIDKGLEVESTPKIKIKMNDNEVYKNCLHDIICILKDISFDEKKDVEKFKLKGKKAGDPLYEYFKGRAVAYFEVLDHICTELEAFNINSKEVCIDIDPEKELKEIPDDWTPEIKK